MMKQSEKKNMRDEDVDRRTSNCNSMKIAKSVTKNITMTQWRRLLHLQ